MIDEFDFDFDIGDIAEIHEYDDDGHDMVILVEVLGWFIDNDESKMYMVSIPAELARKVGIQTINTGPRPNYCVAILESIELIPTQKQSMISKLF